MRRTSSPTGATRKMLLDYHEREIVRPKDEALVAGARAPAAEDRARSVSGYCATYGWADQPAADAYMVYASSTELS